jgi:hypothetical protein
MEFLAPMPSNNPDEPYAIYFNHQTKDPERVYVPSITAVELDEKLMWERILIDAEWVVNCIKENMIK